MTDDSERVRVGDRVTIYPRGAKKIWCADFWQDGAHKKQSLKTTNKKAAVERATKLAADLIGGTFQTPPPAVTVKQAADDYIAFLRTEERAKKTVVKYRGVLDLFIEYLERNKVTRLAQVTAAHLDRYRAERKATKHPKTVYCEGVIVKQLFKWARSRKLIADNPLADVKLNKPPLEPKAGPARGERPAGRGRGVVPRPARGAGVHRYAVRRTPEAVAGGRRPDRRVGSYRVALIPFGSGRRNRLCLL